MLTVLERKPSLEASVERSRQLAKREDGGTISGGVKHGSLAVCLPKARQLPRRDNSSAGANIGGQCARTTLENAEFPPLRLTY